MSGQNRGGWNWTTVGMAVFSATALFLFQNCGGYSGSNYPAQQYYSSIAISSLSVTQGPVGLQISITGSGFTATENTVHFGLGSLAYPTGSVYPNLASNLGYYITFTIPAHWDPACEQDTPPCPNAFIATSPGVYAISVSNSNGQSNSLNFTVN